MALTATQLRDIHIKLEEIFPNYGEENHVLMRLRPDAISVHIEGEITGAQMKDVLNTAWEYGLDNDKTSIKRSGAGITITLS